MTTFSFQNKLTTEEAAEYLGLKPATLNIWRSRKISPFPFYKIRNRIYYLLEDLDRYIANQRHDETNTGDK